MANGTYFNNKKRARQLLDFYGLRWVNVYPTDVDGALEFRGRLFVFLEVKRQGNAVPYGQRVFLERLIDAINGSPGCYATAYVLEHIEDHADVQVAQAVPISMYVKGKWKSLPLDGQTIKDRIDLLITKCGLAEEFEIAS